MCASCGRAVAGAPSCQGFQEEEIYGFANVLVHCCSNCCSGVACCKGPDCEVVPMLCAGVLCACSAACGWEDEFIAIGRMMKGSRLAAMSVRLCTMPPCSHSNRSSSCGRPLVAVAVAV